MALGGTLYLSFTGGRFPWYFPLPFLLLLPAFKSGLDRITHPNLRKLAVTVCLVVVTAQAYLFLDYARVARASMAVNELAVRRQVDKRCGGRRSAAKSAREPRWASQCSDSGM